MTCDGTGWLYLRKPNGYEFARYCDCAANIKIQRLIQSAKVPKDYEAVTINSFDINIYEYKKDQNIAAMAKRLCINYVRDFERFKMEEKGLYLHSEKRGSDKTRLAISLLNALIKQTKVEGFYITTKNLFDELRASFNEGTTQTILNKFMSVNVLVLDDLGVEKTSEWIESTFTQILDTRMNQKLVTIITSNLTQDQLDEIYISGRISSRIKKMTVPIQMPSEDIRAKLAKNANDDILRDLLF
ncbi:ATP-binding protein [Solibacillus merdavium]|uniref:ATP-binding protein n=1 Tax=Solibacillus merdavium TaxID=2762218 RepID=A0ABR8XLV0_9BACL|nr:ATP-binding protein [Solibacillus merdavium]MBD8032909.1 ATP-binding protein [Solibacillus merdavium]